MPSEVYASNSSCVVAPRSTSCLLDLSPRAHSSFGKPTCAPVPPLRTPNTEEPVYTFGAPLRNAKHRSFSSLSAAVLR